MRSDRVRRAVTLLLCPLVFMAVALGSQSAGAHAWAIPSVPIPTTVPATGSTTTTFVPPVPATESATVSPAPTISGISPDWALTEGGQEVTIDGTGFYVPEVEVLFGGTPAVDPGASWPDGTKIYCVAPAHGAGVVQVVVTTPGGSASIAFTYLVAPPPTTGASTTSEAPTTLGESTGPSAGPTESTEMVTSTVAEIEGEDGGLSGGWIAFIVVVGLVALVGLGMMLFRLSKSSGGGGSAA